MSDSKNDIAWSKIYGKYKIVETVAAKSSIIITATQINEFREARLMTKFDHRSQLPKIFSDNQLSILPISRGSYIIGNFEAFQNFEEDSDKVFSKINFPGNLESLNYKEISSEATAINCAFVSEILSDFTNDYELRPTVSGRMGSSHFNFKITANDVQQNVTVNNSQIEIDGGYEGATALNIIEAKNYIANDFLIRQLYYPFRLWTTKIKKTVTPIFLTYTNGIFHLREYTFDDPIHYNSIRLVRQKKYAIREAAINVETIQKILFNTSVVSEPSVPFPQANSFDRIINLCEILKEKESLTRDEVTLNYDFDGRQTNYYTAAAKYLGLIDQKTESSEVVYFLTRIGSNILNQNIYERQLEFVKLILAHLAFKKALELYFEKGEIPTTQEIVQIMKVSNLYNVSTDTTFFRRASTISAWIDWIIDLIEE